MGWGARLSGVTIELATVVCEGAGPVFPGSPTVTRFDNHVNLLTPCQAYQCILEQSSADVIVYSHDDVIVHDPDWLERIRVIFESSPNCVAVGPGGAIGLGNRDLYRKQFNIWNMARIGYASNQDDAEVHGTRFTGDRRVAVIEQFLMAIRSDWLRMKGGWPVEHLSHHMVDAWVACEAARDGREIWQAGFSCLHQGGASSTSAAYREAAWLQGGTLESDHLQPHIWIAEEYRDVMPLEVAV
jgi:hypothetical protein